MAYSHELSRRSFGNFCGCTLATTCAALACGGGIDRSDPVFDGICEPPALADECSPTPSDIEGPFYLPDSPERSDLDTLGDEGVALSLSGRVLAETCGPVADVIVEIWHANPMGEYDNDRAGEYAYRGWVRTDGDGVYAFTTLVPGRYRNAGKLRPSHVHIKLWRDGVEQLVTQLYFAGDPHSEEDPWAEPARTVCLEADGDGFVAAFDLVLA